MGWELGSDVIIRLSGGADSLALTAGACAEVLRPEDALAGCRIRAVVVDHQLQQGSTGVTECAAHMAQEIGVTAKVIAVDINNNSDHGPEYEVRLARYTVLRKVAQSRGAVLMLAHALDDQVETAVLQLARGGGSQALSAIRDNLT